MKHKEITRLKQSIAGYIAQHTKPSLQEGTGNYIATEDRLAIMTRAKQCIDAAYRIGYETGLDETAKPVDAPRGAKSCERQGEAGGHG